MPDNTNVELTEEQQNMVDSIMRALFPVFQAHYDATVGMDTKTEWWPKEIQGLKKAVKLEIEIWMKHHKVKSGKAAMTWKDIKGGQKANITWKDLN